MQCKSRTFEQERRIEKKGEGGTVLVCCLLMRHEAGDGMEWNGMGWDGKATRIR